MPNMPSTSVVMPGTRPAATACGTVPLIRRTLPSVPASVGDFTPTQHGGHAALGIQDHGRVVDVLGQRGRHGGEAARRGLEVQLAADEHELHLDELPELPDGRGSLGVSGRGQVALAPG